MLNYQIKMSKNYELAEEEVLRIITMQNHVQHYK